MPQPASLKAADILALLDADEVPALLKSFGLEVHTPVAEADLLGLESFSISSLLRSIVHLRLPFIRMMNDITRLLETLEAAVRGNIRFIVLPDLQSDLQMDFGPQLRAAIAKNLNSKLLQNHEKQIRDQLPTLKHEIQRICGKVRPMPAERYDDIGQHLKDLSDHYPYHHPQGITYEWLADNVFRSHDLEYNPEDQAGITKIGDKIARLKELLLRLNREKHHPNPLWTELVSVISRLSSMVNFKRNSGPISTEPPHPRRTVQNREFQSALLRVDSLKEAILAASDFEQAHSELFDFLNLEIWKQRWRVYELWILARMVQMLFDWGATLSDTTRISAGRWLLKFANDRSPVLKLALQGQIIEVLYQFKQKREVTEGTPSVAVRLDDGKAGDMPDIAFRLDNDKKFLAVVDPKHGKSFDRSELNGVCQRYADAFDPYLSCVVNYFSTRPSEILVDDPRSRVLYGLMPDSQSEQELHEELEAAICRAWSDRQLQFIRPRSSLVVAFDGSPSAENSRETLLASLRQRFAQLASAVRPESLALVFGSTILREGQISALLDGSLLNDLPSTGTDIGLALREGTRLLAELPQPRELWLLTDGTGSIDINSSEGDLGPLGATIVVFERRSTEGISPLQQLVERLQGEYISV